MKLHQLQSGNPVFFGRYPQGAKGEVQPIAWQVLEVKEDRALLLSRYVLDMQPFYSEAGCVRWIDSTVCQWLRETFLPTAFSQEEQAEIYYPAPKADPNEEGMFCSGATAQMTPWVEANHPGIDQMNGNVCWWLRSSSHQSPFAFIVSPVDSIGGSMIDPDNRQGVRPAIWVKIG